MKAASTHLVCTTQADLPLGRKATIDSFTLGLGGSTVTAHWQSPAGRYSILLVIEAPPHDIPVSEKARAHYTQVELAEVAQRLARGLDPLLFPN